MNELKLIRIVKWGDVNWRDGSFKNRIYVIFARRFARRCRQQAEIIYNEKFDTVMRYHIDGYGQRHLMWDESMDTVLNRPINKLILNLFESLG